MRRLRYVLLLTFCGAALAQTDLEPLRTMLVPLRAVKPQDQPGPRGATPQLTAIKHHLRDWVESRLTPLSARADETEAAREWNSELRDAHLICDPQADCPNWGLLGYLEEVRLERSGGFLILTTGIGIECGFDESAYMYSNSSEGWRRVWQNEQNTYTTAAYHPQTLHQVLISPYSRTNEYVVLTLGSESWCASTWHDVYYRAFRLGPDPSAPPLLEGSQWAWLGGHWPPIRGAVTADDILVEYAAASLDGLAREVVLHYRIQGDTVRRIDPVALSPRGFVEEWIATGWREAANWSEGANRPRLRDWHQQKHPAGEFGYPTHHCVQRPDLWQVSIEAESGAATYFLVRWRPPYRFSLLDIDTRPWPDCTEPDRRADDTGTTLFPGWR
jgi:hypothetical protein